MSRLLNVFARSSLKLMKSDEVFKYIPLLDAVL